MSEFRDRETYEFQCRCGEHVTTYSREGTCPSCYTAYSLVWQATEPPRPTRARFVANIRSQGGSPIVTLGKDVMTVSGLGIGDEVLIVATPGQISITRD